MESGLLELMEADLAKSGLSSKDILARILDENSRQQVSAFDAVKGYVIPYFNINGKLTQYYRAKILNNPKLKYLQIKNSPNHIYFPRNFAQNYHKAGTEGKLCLIVEGEKKAALVDQLGIPCIAFAGVDSWRNKNLILPKGVEQSQKDGKTVLKLPAANIDESEISPIAIGLQELLNISLLKKTTFIIAFDTDTPSGLSVGPQRAAARFGYELRHRGFHIGQIRQLIVPWYDKDSEDSSTVEDIILGPKRDKARSQGLQDLLKMIQETLDKRVAFPRHPNVREYIAKNLQSNRLDRKTAQNVSLSLLTELDSRGTRMYNKDGMQLYYFNGDSKHLMKVNINKQNLASEQESEFGVLLYKEYGIAVNADTSFVKWLGAQFAAEEPVEEVSPYRILARPKKDEDIVRFQINNGEYIKITGDPQTPYKIMANGSESTLFETQEQAEEITKKDLEAHIVRMHNQPLKSWWLEVLKEVKIGDPEKQVLIISLLYYLSPWLQRWRGIQLPIEIVTGEAGSGKSTLFEIRLNILTGDPLLRNTPKEQKDWQAVLANCGGLTVIDNVGKADKNLRETMSDDLCRLVTEYNPRISMRKYFTEADERTISVHSVFGFTAIQPPFVNSDLIQRSIALQLTKQPDNLDGTQSDQQREIFDGFWKEEQLKKFGGRAAWVAHHAIAINRFFSLVSKKWNPGYRAKHRLVHLEQSLVLMAEVFGIDGSWIPSWLSDTTDAAVTKADWTMEGLLAFADMKRLQELEADRRYKYNPKVKPREPLYFSASDIVAWVESEDDHKKNYTLNNTRSLGRYLQNHKYQLAHIAGIIEVGKKQNQMHYKVIPMPEERKS